MTHEELKRLAKWYLSGIDSDTRGTPLNAGSGTGAQAVGGFLVCRHPTAWVTAQGRCLQCGQDTATLPVVPKQNVDPKEEALRAKLIPAFRHEEACNPPPIKGYPMLPYFADAPERNEQSRRELKRWISTNLKDWPVCRFERTPLNLVIEGRPMRDDPYGGERAVPQFHCPSCGRYGEVT